MGRSVFDMLTILDQAAQTAYHINAYYRDIESAPEEVMILARRVSQYSSLLEVATKTMSDSAPSQVLVGLSQSIVLNSSQAMNRIQEAVSLSFGGKHRNILRRVESLIRWNSKKKGISLMTSEVESLKLDLTVMLQMHQIQSFEARYLLTSERVVGDSGNRTLGDD
jgi:hypothetical protein